LHEQNIAIVLITHDLAIADRTQRKIQVRDGLIVD
jgi:predicted ABC-type transport system involved in lysophospholipase L1 biosynthesis ATPase subunit